MKPTEKHTEVRAFRVDYLCEKCGGEMVFSGTILTSFPELYVHYCGKCGESDNLKRRTGHIIYKEKP